MLHCLLLVWALGSLRPGGAAPPSAGLEDAPDWLLAETLHQPPRRITPKSVFVAPTFSACGPGYRQDNGRCVRVVKVNQQAQWDFFLQKLNAMYAPPEPTKNRRTQGPLHVALPINPPTTPIPPTTTTTSTTTMEIPSTTTTEVPTTTTQESTTMTTTTIRPLVTTVPPPLTTEMPPVTYTPVTDWENIASTIQSTWTEQQTGQTSTEGSRTVPTESPPMTYASEAPSSAVTFVTESGSTYPTSMAQETATVTTATETTTETSAAYPQMHQQFASSDQVVSLDLPVKAKCSPTFQVTSFDSDSLPVDCEEVSPPVPARLSLPPVRTVRPHLEAQTIQTKLPYVQTFSPVQTLSSHVQTYAPQLQTTAPVRTPVRFPERRRPSRPSFVRFPDRTWGYWWPAWDRRASSFQRVEHYPAGWGYHSHNTAHPNMPSSIGSAAS